MSTGGEHDPGLVVLSLDGGGIRGLSSLLILQEIMTRLQHQLGLEKRPEVYEHFDIIGGTGTGGISAVMLGRLRIPLSKAIDHFAKLGEDVFSNNSFFNASNAERSRKMQQALKGIIQKAMGDENETMMDYRPDNERCNTVVFAMAKHNMGLPRAFRSYQAWVNQMPDCAIWEALSATTAHPDLFESVSISDGPVEQPFVDGGLGCNNPLPQILAELNLIYPERHVGCVISIGAGHANTIQIPSSSSFGSILLDKLFLKSFLPGNVIKIMKAIAMDSERDAQHMANRFIMTQDLYYRLNVDQGMQSVELHNWERMGEVAAHTQGYMQLAGVIKTVNGSLKAIKNKNRVVPVVDIGGQLPVSTNRSREEEIDTRLDRLSPAKDARYNSALSASMTKRGACTANTRTEVLTNAYTWTRDRSAARIYWMNGMAGTGKTTIAYSLCKRLEENEQLGASFFCSRDSPTCRDVTKLVPTIAYQLGRFSNIYRQVVCNVLNKDPDVAHKDIETQFENLIAKPLVPLKTATPRDVVVVIDALDECADVQRMEQVLDLLLKYATELPIKFFVTSRPEPSISNKIELQNDSSRSILHLHDIEKSIVQADIKTYFDEALKSIHPSDAVLEQLTSLAGCLFIFAATAVRYIIPGHGSANPEVRLQTILNASSIGSSKKYAQLDALYTTILSKALDGSILEEDELELQHRVLSTVVCAREPSTSATLAELLGLPSERQVLSAIQSLRSVLHVSEGSGVISTLHASFPDFLLSEERSQTFHCAEVQHNEYLAARCFNVMKDSVRFNICGLETSYRFDKDVPNLQTRVDNAISMGLFYACRYWSDHLLGAAAPNTLVPHLDEFLRHRLLFWMEVLKLKECIGHGEGILSQVLRWLPTDDTLTELRQFTYDARDFVTTFAGNPTSLSTPHIYLSVLPFTSKQSHVRTNYWPRTRGLIRVEGTRMEARGTVQLATWKVGSGVESIAQSGDGKRIVSGCRGGTVSIWDVSKGTRIVGPLQAGGYKDRLWVEGVAFSSDGTRIASASASNWPSDGRRIASASNWPDSQGGTIRIWDAHNGNLITDLLKDNTQPVSSIAFSPDGTRLIWGSEDRTIRMWDARNGNPLGNPFQGYQYEVLSVVFSPDGNRIASGSRGCTIQIWDVHSATTTMGPLKGHTGSVNSVAFSPDGLRVVSGSDDQTVRLWDVQSGTSLADPFRGHTQSVLSVAFSPDGTRVVSASWDGTIRIWDAQHGALIAGPLEGHSGRVNSVLFSTDGTRILSGSDDGTICVWDARHGTTAAAKSSGHTAAILSVAFSPGGTRLVSGSADRTIRVWDTRDGRLVVGPLEGHSHSVLSVAFSPDAAQIVSGSKDRTIRTWDAHSGSLIGVPFEGHSGSVVSVAYSPDGNHIVSGSEDRSIRVWNSQTGKLAAEPFRGHAHSVESVAWSPDCTRIVSGSWDKTVQMWRAHDGTSLWASKTHTDYVFCVAYSPDGTRVVSGSYDTILVLNADDGTTLHRWFEGLTDSILSVAFSPEGTRIVSGSGDCTVCVLLSGPFQGHIEGASSVAFSPDGRRVVSGSSDKTIRFWDVAAADKPLSPYFDSCTLRYDGWVVHSDSQLLMWLPPDLRAEFPLPGACSGIIDPERVLLVHYNDLLVGEHWKECYPDSAAEILV